MLSLCKTHVDEVQAGYGEEAYDAFMEFHVDLGGGFVRGSHEGNHADVNGAAHKP